MGAGEGVFWGTVGCLVGEPARVELDVVVEVEESSSACGFHIALYNVSFRSVHQGILYLP